MWKKKILTTLKTSFQLEQELDEHFKQLEDKRIAIQDLTVQERNNLQNQRDMLLVELNLVDNLIEELRKRSERVYIRVKEEQSSSSL